MQNNPEFILNQKGLVFKLREHGLIQSVLINSILKKTNCHIDDLATILQTNTKKLEQVLLEKELLSENESINLVSLFYIAHGSRLLSC